MPVVNTQYEDKKLKNGLKGDRQNFRHISVRTTAISYELPEVTKTVERFDEETGREWNETIVLRPRMTTGTNVVCSRNRFGIMKLYGTQG